MKKIILILIFLCFSCGIKKSLLYNRYYSNDNSMLIMLNKDSTFILQDKLSLFSSNGTIIGKYFLNEKGNLCIDSLIERLKLPYLIIQKPQNKDEFKIVVNIEEEVYSNINVFVNIGDKEVFLGSLDEKGETEFTYNEELNDMVKVLFKYDKSIGYSSNSNYDTASTEPIFINKGYNEIRMNFNSDYFDLKNLNEINKRCFKIRKNKIY